MNTMKSQQVLQEAHNGVSMQRRRNLIIVLAFLSFTLVFSYENTEKLYKNYNVISKDVLPNFVYYKFEQTTWNDCMEKCVNKYDKNIMCLGFGFNNSDTLTPDKPCMMILQSNTETNDSTLVLDNIAIEKVFTKYYNTCEEFAAAVKTGLKTGIYHLYLSKNPSQRYAVCNQTGEGN